MIDRMEETYSILNTGCGDKDWNGREKNTHIQNQYQHWNQWKNISLQAFIFQLCCKMVLLSNEWTSTGGRIDGWWRDWAQFWLFWGSGGWSCMALEFPGKWTGGSFYCKLAPQRSEWGSAEGGLRCENSFVWGIHSSVVLHEEPVIWGGAEKWEGEGRGRCLCCCGSLSMFWKGKTGQMLLVFKSDQELKVSFCI